MKFPLSYLLAVALVASNLVEASPNDETRSLSGLTKRHYKKYNNNYNMNRNVAELPAGAPINVVEERHRRPRLPLHSKYRRPLRLPSMRGPPNRGGRAVLIAPANLAAVQQPAIPPTPPITAPGPAILPVGVTGPPPPGPVLGAPPSSAAAPPTNIPAPTIPPPTGTRAPSGAPGAGGAGIMIADDPDVTTAGAPLAPFDWAGIKSQLGLAVPVSGSNDVVTGGGSTPVVAGGANTPVASGGNPRNPNPAMTGGNPATASPTVIVPLPANPPSPSPITPGRNVHIFGAPDVPAQPELVDAGPIPPGQAVTAGTLPPCGLGLFIPPYCQPGPIFANPSTPAVTGGGPTPVVSGGPTNPITPGSPAMTGGNPPVISPNIATPLPAPTTPGASLQYGPGVTSEGIPGIPFGTGTSTSASPDVIGTPPNLPGPSPITSSQNLHILGAPDVPAQPELINAAPIPTGEAQTAGYAAYCAPGIPSYLGLCFGPLTGFATLSNPGVTGGGSTPGGTSSPVIAPSNPATAAPNPPINPPGPSRVISAPIQAAQPNPASTPIGAPGANPSSPGVVTTAGETLNLLPGFMGVEPFGVISGTSPALPAGAPPAPLAGTPPAPLAGTPPAPLAGTPPAPPAGTPPVPAAGILLAPAARTAPLPAGTPPTLPTIAPATPATPELIGTSPETSPASGLVTTAGIITRPQQVVVTPGASGTVPVVANPSGTVLVNPTAVGAPVGSVLTSPVSTAPVVQTLAGTTPIIANSAGTVPVVQTFAGTTPIITNPAPIVETLPGPTPVFVNPAGIPIATSSGIASETFVSPAPVYAGGVPILTSPFGTPTLFGAPGPGPVAGGGPAPARGGGGRAPAANAGAGRAGQRH
ncbi:hypothetical protein HDV00_001132 [Rhizophlyctis rosea]|nr:hypothetical protein HDV00_001132 [Rhizophlyctis rosea]